MSAPKRMRFRAELLAGHKGNAVEVPFDPAGTWGVEPQPLWPGRRGYPVEGTANGEPFTSAIVPRMRRHFLLLDAESGTRTTAAVGDTVGVVVWPQTEAAPAARKRR